MYDTGSFSRFDSTIESTEVGKFLCLLSRKIKSIGVSNTILYRGFIATWTKPMWRNLYFSWCWRIDCLENKERVLESLFIGTKCSAILIQ